MAVEIRILNGSPYMLNRFTLASRIFLDNFREPARPYKLTFAATNLCNSRCRSCATWRQEAKDELGVDEVERFFASNNYFYWLDFTGGEYFLRSDAIEIVKVALFHSRRCFHFHIPSNCIDPQRTVTGAREILKIAPELFTLTISLDGPPEIHDRIRGVPGNWDSAMTVYRELSAFRSKSFRIFFGFTLSQWNVGCFADTVAAVQQQFPAVQVHDFHMNLYHASSHYYHTEGKASLFPGGIGNVIAEVDRFRQGVRWRIDPISILENRYLVEIPNYLTTNRSPLPCQALAGSLFLGTDGTLYPCSIWNRPLGNLRRDGFDLRSILKDAYRVREEIRAEKCPGCWTPCEAYPTILAGFIPHKWASFWKGFRK